MLRALLLLAAYAVRNQDSVAHRLRQAGEAGRKNRGFGGPARNYAAALDKMASFV